MSGFEADLAQALFRQFEWVPQAARLGCAGPEQKAQVCQTMERHLCTAVCVPIGEQGQASPLGWLLESLTLRFPLLCRAGRIDARAYNTLPLAATSDVRHGQRYSKSFEP